MAYISYFGDIKKRREGTQKSIGSEYDLIIEIRKDWQQSNLFPVFCLTIIYDGNRILTVHHIIDAKIESLLMPRLKKQTKPQIKTDIRWHHKVID